jgi:hypothetical protein
MKFVINFYISHEIILYKTRNIFIEKFLKHDFLQEYFMNVHYANKTK